MNECMYVCMYVVSKASRRCENAVIIECGYNKNEYICAVCARYVTANAPLQYFHLNHNAGTRCDIVPGSK
jgi:hypothetical protein